MQNFNIAEQNNIELQCVISNGMSYVLFLCCRDNSKWVPLCNTEAGSGVKWSHFLVHQTVVHISCLFVQYTSVYLHRSIYTVLYSNVVSFHLCSVCQATSGVGKRHLFSTHLLFGKSLVHKATSDAKTTNNITLIKGNLQFLSCKMQLTVILETLFSATHSTIYLTI